MKIYVLTADDYVVGAVTEKYKADALSDLFGLNIDERDDTDLDMFMSRAGEGHYYNVYMDGKKVVDVMLYDPAVDPMLAAPNDIIEYDEITGECEIICVAENDKDAERVAREIREKYLS